MTTEEKLQAEEEIMDAVCELCHWPYVYHGDHEDDMYEEKCDVCPAARAVAAMLEKVTP